MAAQSSKKVFLIFMRKIASFVLKKYIKLFYKNFYELSEPHLISINFTYVKLENKLHISSIKMDKKSLSKNKMEESVWGV